MSFPILHEFNLERKANIVDFHGWQMPVSYEGIREEYKATREKASIFDVSHMGRWFFSGKNAMAFLDYLTTNDLSSLKDGKAIYTTLLNEEGGIIDDLVVYKFNPERFLLINNAGNHDAVTEWFRLQSHEDIIMEDITAKLAQIAIQGPLAKDLVNKYLGLKETLSYFSFREISFNNENYIVSATGYTGEAGYEIYAKPSLLIKLVKDLCKHSELVPAGLGARDVLRLEAGYCLHGNDIDNLTTPYEAGLDWIVKITKENFIGKSNCTRQNKILRGLLFPVSEKIIPRAGTKVYDEEEREIGVITSGTFSFILDRAIALVYLTDPMIIKSIISNKTDLTSKINLKKVSIKVRKDIFSASIVEPWFYRNIRGKEIQDLEAIQK
ncbi:MAG: glycine cleavage system aminomethyltransferase GcvT [Proteobacteria bacterium]|nr:glycine cleavage system aminomethyltransferase GcvT [Pseudomonadota bacterium]